MIQADYTLRYSKKAKHLQLRVSPKGVEVVVPEKMRISESYIRDFVFKKNDWILKTQQRYASFNHDKEQKPVLPNQIHLLSMNQIWEVNYIATLHKRVTIHPNAARQIVIMGDIKNEEACLRLLKLWLTQIAEHHLCEMLRKVSQEVGISFQQISIRNNTTRWGSCSSQKNISLCCRLLFLPDYLVRHVLLHELCHTKFMHHGRSFWGLLEKLDINTHVHIKELKKASLLVPSWVE